MCGLVGSAGDIQKADRDMFNQKLQVDVIRGPHSTGVASVNVKGEIALFKRALNPVDLMMCKQYEQVVQWDSQVLIGHNRYATVGKINHVTAHPFQFDGLVGAHNGTLVGWRQDLADSDLFDVDSECLIWNIKSKGWDETIARARGAMALTVYHEDTHSLCLYRNAERPLYFTYNEEGTCLYWASEAWMIRAMAARNGIKLGPNMASLKENHLVSWQLPSAKNRKLNDPHVRKLEVPAPQKKPQPQTYHRAPQQQQRQALPPATQAAGSTSRQTGASSFCTDLSTDAAWLALSVGSIIDFIPCSYERSNTTGQPYLAGVMSDDPWCEVRLYTTAEHIEEMIESECEYSAAIASKCPQWGRDEDYIIIQNKGLTQGENYKLKDAPTEVDDDIPFEATLISGPGGVLIDREQFNEYAKHGCGECSCDLDFDDDFEWFAGSPVCADCMMQDIEDNKEK